ncbi:unnamed protein product, partial [Notodromas monacha]
MYRTSEREFFYACAKRDAFYTPVYLCFWTSFKMLMEVAQEWESIEEIQLEPFIHQVGGHSSILSLDESTICKPLVLQEVEFYKSLPSNMREFTAEFRGIVEVSSVQDENGAITLLRFRGGGLLRKDLGAARALSRGSAAAPS